MAIVKRIDVQAIDPSNIPYSKFGFNSNYKDKEISNICLTPEDIYKIDYEYKKKFSTEKGDDYTWEDYIEDEVLDMIRRKIGYRHHVYQDMNVSKQDVIEELLKSDKLTDQEKFRFIYTKLDKLS